MQKFTAALVIVFVTEALSSTILIMYEKCDPLKIAKAHSRPSPLRLIPKWTTAYYIILNKPTISWSREWFLWGSIGYTSRGSERWRCSDTSTTRPHGLPYTAPCLRREVSRYPRQCTPLLVPPPGQDAAPIRGRLAWYWCLPACRGVAWLSKLWACTAAVKQSQICQSCTIPEGGIVLCQTNTPNRNKKMDIKDSLNC